MAAKPRRKGGSGADHPASRGAPPASSSNAILIGIAAIVLVGVGVGAAVVLKGNPADPAPAAGVTSAPTPAGDDPFASVPRAGADLGGDDVGTFSEKLGEDSFTIAFPKSFQVRVGSVADGKKFTFRHRDKSAVVWVVGALKDAVTTADLLREIQLEPSSRAGVKPQSQRLGPVVGSGEHFTIAAEPDPLEGIVLRAPYGTDREVVALAVAPSRTHAVVDAMLGSLRSAKVQGVRAVGGVTYLPR